MIRYEQFYSINDDTDCRNKICIIICDALDVELKVESKKVVVHGTMFNHYLSKNYNYIIKALKESRYSLSGFIENDFKSNIKAYTDLYKINVGDYCIIQETYKDETYGFIDKIISISSKGVQMKAGWIRREHLLFLDQLEKGTSIELCTCDE